MTVDHHVTRATEVVADEGAVEDVEHIWDLIIGDLAEILMVMFI